VRWNADEELWIEGENTIHAMNQKGWCELGGGDL